MTDRPIEKVLTRLGDRVGRQHGDTYECRCPGHEDNQASLSVSVGDDGRVLMHCHAGCAIEDVLGHLRLAKADLFADNGQARPAKGEIVATYDYRDADGNLVYQAVRKSPKGFFQRRPKPGGGWINDMRGVERIPYRLPDLLSADPSDPVFVVEGEKDADHCHHAGLVATCNVGGAGKWSKKYSEYLTDRHVVILPDNDTPGKNHAQKVAQSLQGVAASVKVLLLPDLPGNGGDVSDWLDAGHPVEELKELAGREPVWTPTEFKAPRARIKTTDEPGDQRRLTDMGNAERLVDQHGENIRFCWPWQKWVIWDGRRWQIDEGGRIDDLAQRTVRSIYQEAARLTDGADRANTAKWAMISERRERVNAMIAMARSKVGVQPNELDQKPWLLNIENGTIDLKTGDVHAHCRDDYLTALAPVVHEPDANCPIWFGFLQRIFADDRALIRYVQRLAGYSLTGAIGEHVLPVAYGTGANGKSTLINTVMGMLGSDYAMKAAPDLLMEKRQDSHPTERADLFRKRFVAAIETAQGRRLAETLVKEMTGGDPIRARRMREDFWEFDPTHKIWLATNHKPIVRGNDHGIWRRIKLVPFTVSIPDDEQDHKLPEKLRAEYSGILNWALIGCSEWAAEGLGHCDAVDAATSTYRREMDVIGQFLDDQCLLGPGYEARASELHKTYKAWCENSGFKPMNATNFGLALNERGIPGEKRRDYVWRVGVQVRVEGCG